MAARAFKASESTPLAHPSSLDVSDKFRWSNLIRKGVPVLTYIQIFNSIGVRSPFVSRINEPPLYSIMDRSSAFVVLN
jgi:hypothetical protein